MNLPVQRRLLLLVLLVGMAATTWTPRAFAQAAPAATDLTITGAGPTPLVVSAADLKKMPRTTLRVLNPHNQKTETYEGVAIGNLLAKAGMPQGEQLKGPWLAAYAVMEAGDGYRVVFSLPELDVGYVDSGVLIADTMDGAPLAAGEGPFKLIAPKEKQAARWLRLLKTITIVRLPVPGK